MIIGTSETNLNNISNNKNILIIVRNKLKKDIDILDQLSKQNYLILCSIFFKKIQQKIYPIKPIMLDNIFNLFIRDYLNR